MRPRHPESIVLPRMSAECCAHIGMSGVVLLGSEPPQLPLVSVRGLHRSRLSNPAPITSCPHLTLLPGRSFVLEIALEGQCACHCSGRHFQVYRTICWFNQRGTNMWPPLGYYSKDVNDPGTVADAFLGSIVQDRPCQEGGEVQRYGWRALRRRAGAKTTEDRWMGFQQARTRSVTK